MTLIWATKVQDKWILIADDAVTIGQVMSSARDWYRPKIREIVGKNVTLIAAGCGTIKDIDYVLNIVENKLANKKFKTTNELKFFLQDVLADTHKELKELTSDPQAAFVFLEPKTDTLWIADEYSIIEPKDYASIAFGSADQTFYKLRWRWDFFQAFCRAVEADEYCNFPLVSYRDGEIELWYGRPEEEKSFYQLGKENDDTIECCSNLCCEPIYDSRHNICEWTNKEL